MGKKNNSAAKAAAQAAAQQAPGSNTSKQSNAEENNAVTVIQLSDLEKLTKMGLTAGMDPNHQEDLIARLDDRFYRDKDAAKKYNIPQTAVDKINEVTMRGMLALLGNEMVYGQNPFAVKMREHALPQFREAAADMGMNIDVTMLPAPKDGQIEIPSNAISVSEETKDAIKEEHEATQKAVVLDPTKIESEDQLKSTLLHILVKGTNSANLYDKISAAINFYESYLGIKAGAAEDSEAARAKLKEKSRADFLTEISNLLGKCTFSVNATAKFMYENTERTKSPVVAFCTMREASINEKNGMPKIDDSLVADITKVLVRWYGKGVIEECQEFIKNGEKNLEVLKADAKKNAKGIEDAEKKLEGAKKKIDHVNEVIEFAYNPPADVVNSFADNYTNEQAEGYKMARMMGSKVMKTYYPGVDVKSVKKECLLHNLSQYVGTITNMFLPPLSQLEQYCEANITELELNESPEEGEGEKNA